MAKSLPASFNFDWTPKFITYAYDHRYRRRCTFEPGENCLQAATRAIAKIEGCKRVKVYIDNEVDAAISKRFDCYILELYWNDEAKDPVTFELELPRTLSHAAIDAAAQVYRSLTEKSAFAR